ncbi:MAG: DUF1848 domain-containing protein [Deltaproteobacteria bacterium]|jgi:hypothetical protein|nr:DUF1848 domain-containing protein [Deltaproteobacteria bacterium]
MIISCSRRTDIPAFYANWLVNRLKAGYVLVPNPFNRRKVTELILTPETVDCLVFWTKNPESLAQRLPEIQDMGFRFYILFTLNPYGSDLEPGLPPKKSLIKLFETLSQTYGPATVDWRYDPIIIDEERPVKYHLERLAHFGEILAPRTTRLIFSFVDNYRHLKPLGTGTAEEWLALAEGLGNLSQKWGLPVYSCAETFDLGRFGLRPGTCVDRAKIEALIGRSLNIKKDPGQRDDCQCYESFDIGLYNTCGHLCVYCYATHNHRQAVRATVEHDPNWPILTGTLKGDEEIYRHPKQKGLCL